MQLFIKISLLFLSTMCCAGHNSLPLVFDGKLNANSPKRFRILDSRGLKAIASGQFSEAQLLELKAQLKAPIIIVDLRQESHGFVNGYPVSWYGPKNQANMCKRQKQIQTDEQNALLNLLSSKTLTIDVIQTKSKHGTVKTQPMLTLKPQRVETEAELAARLGVGYIRFYVADHKAPTLAQVHEFRTFIHSLPDETWIYVHCRGGSGRTTTFLMLYDIFKNGKTLSFAEMVNWHHQKGGKDLSNLPEKNSYQYQDAVNRVRLIQQIYGSK